MNGMLVTAITLCLAISAGGGGSIFGQSGATDTVAGKRQGFFRRTFVDDSGNSRRYVMFVPAHSTGAKPPVLLFLNGIGENGDDGLRQISNNFGIQVWESRDFYPFIAVAPQCRVEGNWVPNGLDVKWALQILDEVIREFDADEDRVCLTGVSSGGSGVWAIASAFPDKFSAILPLCGTGGSAVRLSASHLPIWNIYNDGDAPGLVDSNRSLRRQLIEQGSSALLTEYHAGGHECWNRAYRTTALYGWLLEQSRSKNKKSSPFHYWPPLDVLAKWTQSGHGVWRAGEDGVLIGSGEETKAPGSLISESATVSGDLHGDLWLDNETECRIGLIGEGSFVESWVSVVPSELGTGGLVTSQGEWLGRLDPAAQHTLRSDAWNDVRIRLADGRVTVRLNGWPALDVPLSSSKESAPSAPNYRWALGTPSGGSKIHWRFIRTRTEDTVLASRNSEP